MGSSIENPSHNYQKYDAPVTSGAIKEYGTGGVEVPNAQWAGMTFSAFSVEGVSAGRILRVDAGTLKSFDAAANSGAVTLGTLPSDVEDLFAYGNGDEVLGWGWDTAAANSDIFYLRSNQANSLKRITTTPAISEELI